MNGGTFDEIEEHLLVRFESLVLSLWLDLLFQLEHIALGILEVTPPPDDLAQGMPSAGCLHPISVFRVLFDKRARREHLANGGPIDFLLPPPHRITQFLVHQEIHDVGR